MQAKGKFSKKQIDLLILSILFLTIFFPKDLVGEDLNFKIEKYVKNLNSFSSKFIQLNGSSIEEGYIYIKDTKIRIDYFNPKRTLKISKKKGVYINHELEEEEFFSTEKNIVKIFYDIFLDVNFFSSLVPHIGNGEIVYQKTITIEKNDVYLKIIFENSPLLLKKITSESDDEIISISFNDHNYNSSLERDFFSFVPKYPN